MLYFNADPRDGSSVGGACNTCCCQEVNARPGETNKWAINYAAWSVPIGGRGLTVNTTFTIEDKTAAPATGGNQKPVVTYAPNTTPINTPLTDVDLKPFVSDPEAATLTFKLLPTYGPFNGVVTITENGLYTYTPNPGYVGPDHFFYSVSDDANDGVVGEVGIYVRGAGDVTTPAPPETPKVYVRPLGVKVDNRMARITFPVAISPAAAAGEIHRITVRQQALDCEDNEYWHVSCYDIVIGRC